MSERRCAHDGGKCHHGCADNWATCFRAAGGMWLSAPDPQPMDPKPGFAAMREQKERARAACEGQRRSADVTAQIEEVRDRGRVVLSGRVCTCGHQRHDHVESPAESVIRSACLICTCEEFAVEPPGPAQVIDDLADALDLLEEVGSKITAFIKRCRRRNEL